MMASAKTVTTPCAAVRPATLKNVSPVSRQASSFFGPRMPVQSTHSRAVLRAREAVKVEARAGAKAGQQVQVSEHFVLWTLI